MGTEVSETVSLPPLQNTAARRASTRLVVTREPFATTRVTDLEIVDTI